MADNLTITSPAFEEGGAIPKKYSGEDIEISPPLNLENLNGNAKSVAIIMQDINSPMGSINHWVIWNIPAQKSIPEDISKTLEPPEMDGALQGRNIMRRVGYMGPKPPWGTHTYTFYVYALDDFLKLESGASKRQLEKAMGGHVLQRGTLSGIYTHTKKKKRNKKLG